MKKVLGLVLVALLSLACEKKCEVETENKTSGDFATDLFSVIPVTDAYRQDVLVHFTKSEHAPPSMKVSLDDGAVYAPVDFDKYDVLGFYRVGFCEVSYTRAVKNDSINKEFSFRVDLFECGDCEIRRENMNWVLVDKIPENYELIFKGS
ncbi:MAG: hypothetical protein ACJAY8_000402 [Sphingobacteriales bacterium]|jgi:hypothetical protein